MMTTIDLKSLSSMTAAAVLIEEYVRSKAALESLVEDVAKKILQNQNQSLNEATQEDKEQQVKDNRIKQAILSAVSETRQSTVGYIPALENFFNQIESRTKAINVEIPGFNNSREQEQLNSMGLLLKSLKDSIVNATKIITRIKGRGEKAEVKDLTPSIQITTSAAGSEDITKSINSADIAQQMLAIQDNPAALQSLIKSSSASTTIPKSDATNKPSEDKKSKEEVDAYVKSAMKDPNLNVAFSKFLQSKNLPKINMADFTKLITGNLIIKDSAEAIVREFMKSAQPKK